MVNYIGEERWRFLFVNGNGLQISCSLSLYRGSQNLLEAREIGRTTNREIAIDLRDEIF